MSRPISSDQSWPLREAISGRDITFLAEFQGDFKVIRRTAGDGRSVGLDEGRAFPLKETYCYRIASGEWPNVISNARKDGRVKDLALTAQPNIGMYVSVPVVIPGSRC